MKLRAIRRQCEDVLRDVALPDPFTVADFCAAVSDRRGRALRLLPKQTRVGPCGVWLALPGLDYIFYEDATSQLHREHIILHELGHVLCDHQPTEVIDDEVLSQLLPSLDPLVVRRVLGRTTYTAVEEQEAEMLAALVRERVERRVRLSSTDGDVDTGDPGSDRSVVAQLRAAL